MTRIGVLGHGRFGSALSQLLVEAGFEVVAYDPRSHVPADRRVEDIRDAVLERDVVILATPVGMIRDVLATIRPYLDPKQLVIDVGSVKVAPVQAMTEVLGTEIPWVATHPLFGPVSLASGERALRVVICPNSLHPSAIGKARQIYERLGCWTLEQDPEAHDRAMANTHALAFFLAKGMLDAGVDPRTPNAPPSFQAMAGTIEAVRADAGHLFSAIQRENAYAAEARKRLLDALLALDQSIASNEGMDGALQIPTGNEPVNSELRETRDAIDELDRQMIELLARRAKLSERARRAKAREGRPVHDPTREAQLMSARREWAKDEGIDVESTEDVFRAILRFSRRVQS